MLLLLSGERTLLVLCVASIFAYRLAVMVCIHASVFDVADRQVKLVVFHVYWGCASGGTRTRTPVGSDF